MPSITNTLIGDSAGRDLTTAENNSFFGYATGREVTTGNNNTALGFGSLLRAISPSNSVAVGYLALGEAVADGTNNVAIGASALSYYTDSGATAIGASALRLATGIRNVAIGTFAGGTVTTGAGNILIGWNVGGVGSGHDPAVSDSIAIGYNIGTNRQGQIVLGGAQCDEFKLFATSFAKWNPTSHNLFLGQAGNLSATGQYNTALGENAMANASSAHSSVAYGPFALESIVDGNQNVAIGGSTLRNALSVGDSTVVGAQAGENAKTGVGMVAVGHRALGKCIAVNNQSAVGDSALWLNQGARNVAFGYVVAEYIQSGDDGIYIGTAAGRNRANGDRNILIGAQAGSIASATVDPSTGAGAVTVGNRNLSIGYQALLESTGSDHVAIGDSAAKSLSSGESCVFIGSGAGDNLSQKTDAAGCIVIGSGTYSTRDNEIVIGSSSQTHVTIAGVEFTKAQIEALLALVS